MSLLKSINDKWCRFQGELFPEIGSEVGPLTKKYELFVYVLEMVYPESFIHNVPQKDGRPEASRVNMARAFLAKAVWTFPPRGP